MNSRAGKALWDESLLYAPPDFTGLHDKFRTQYLSEVDMTAIEFFRKLLLHYGDVGRLLNEAGATPKAIFRNE
jgi:hypothetical protein